MKFLKLYAESYRGLSRPAWVLAWVILVNRAGSMVLPFLSIYLREAKGLSLEQTGVILSLFGAGSLVGSFLGGWLTDKVGSFAVQTFALIAGGLCFLVLLHIDTFAGFAVGIFLTTVVTDTLRPANSTAVAHYTKKENLTRAYSLNRMATNLGFTVGPAIGGFLAVIDYDLLFYVDGFTCMAAGAVFAVYFLNLPKVGEPSKIEDTSVSAKPKPPWKDRSFMFFIVLVAGYGTVFFQLLTALPLYYREDYLLPENQIGWLLALNGFLVFAIEMPLVNRLGKGVSLKRIIGTGALLAGAALVILNMYRGMWVLIVSMAILSISEILAMPFMTTYTVNRADEKSRGRYLGLYSVGYSVAFILAPMVATFFIDYSGYTMLWYVLGSLSLVVTIGMVLHLKEDVAPKKEA